MSRLHPVARTVTAAANSVPVMLFQFEYLLGFRGTFRRGVVYLVKTTLVQHNFVHLLLRNESSMVSEPVLSQVFSAVVAHVVVVLTGLFLGPILLNLGFALVETQVGASE